MCLNGVPIGKKEKEKQYYKCKILKRHLAENFPVLMKGTNHQILEGEKLPGEIN